MQAKPLMRQNSLVCRPLIINKYIYAARGINRHRSRTQKHKARENHGFEHETFMNLENMTLPFVQDSSRVRIQGII